VDFEPEEPSEAQAPVHDTSVLQRSYRCRDTLHVLVSDLQVAPSMKLSTTKTNDREQWRARILRALAELQSEAPALEPREPRDERKADGSSGASGL
jgi:hypothetical protein